MKPFYPFLLLLLWCSGAVGQPVYFDELYDGHFFIETLKNAVPHQDGYLFNARSRDISGDTATMSLILIDFDGQELMRTEYSPGKRMNYGTLVTHSDSGYAFFNSVGDSANLERDFHLIRYGSDGEVLYTRSFPREGDDICFYGLQCADGGFALCGQAGSTGSSSTEIMLVKTDTLGNEQWRGLYGGSSGEGGADLVQTPDGGFLLLGWTRSYGAGQRDFYLVKTDADGIFQWRKTYGTSGEDVGSSIIRLANGNYLLTGGGTNSAVTTAKGYLYEVSSDGNQVWHSEYASGPSQGDYLFQSIQLEDGSILSCGLADNVSTGGNAGWLVKTNSTGELVWQRVYDKNAATDLFYSLLETDDGGFLLSGQAMNEETNSQDAWLLKVDSIGCPYPNCTVGIDEQENTVMVDVWPNPATEVLNMEFLPVVKGLDVRVVDMDGREILRFTQNDNLESIDVSAWPSGIYVVSGVDDDRRSFSLKVVRE